jgi:hypothetical protein
LIFRQLNLPRVHFWDHRTSAFSKIAIIYSRGVNYKQEDIVCHAWGEICDLYFPKVAATDTAPRWAVDREAYRGLPPFEPSHAKPDLIVVKLMPVIPNEPNLFLPYIESRDFLWIECKAATEDTPSGWKNALAEAATRLNIANSTRIVYLMIAVGGKCAFFLWDPINVLPRPHIFISPVSDQQLWLVDRRIKAFINSTWVDPLSGEFNPTRALKLECFWQTLENDQTVLANHRTLAMIEQFLVYIQNSALQGLNPTIF